MTTVLGIGNLLREVRADGLRLGLENENLVVRGDRAVRDRWRPVLAHAKVAIIAALAKPAANDQPASKCGDCVHASVFGNCAEPVAAGLAERFILTKHLAGGRGCAAFEHKITVIEQRLRDLIAIGAIDAADANFCRRRYMDEPAVWDLLLNACEAAVKGNGGDETR